MGSKEITTVVVRKKNGEEDKMKDRKGKTDWS